MEDIILKLHKLHAISCTHYTSDYCKRFTNTHGYRQGSKWIPLAPDFNNLIRPNPSPLPNILIKRPRVDRAFSKIFHNFQGQILFCNFPEIEKQILPLLIFPPYKYS